MRRLNPSFLVSLAIHAVLVAAVAHVGFGTGTWLSFRQSPEKPRAESVRYVAIPGRTASVPVAGREGGDGIPEREPLAAPEPMPAAPSVVPSVVPAAPSSATSQPPSGRGPLVGRGGPLRGIEPAYNDSRVWAELDHGPPVKLTQKERVDSVIAERFAQYRDSLLVATGGKEPAKCHPLVPDCSDWTVEKGGHKWGMDQSMIRLGPVSIPTTILALLPLNSAKLQGNVFAMERKRQQNAWSREINEQAQRSMNEDEFRVAVKRLRERKERERERKREEGQTVASP